MFELVQELFLEDAHTLQRSSIPTAARTFRSETIAFTGAYPHSGIVFNLRHLFSALEAMRAKLE